MDNSRAVMILRLDNKVAMELCPGYICIYLEGEGYIGRMIPMIMNMITGKVRKVAVSFTRNVNGMKVHLKVVQMAKTTEMAVKMMEVMPVVAVAVVATMMAKAMIAAAAAAVGVLFVVHGDRAPQVQMIIVKRMTVGLLINDEKQFMRRDI